MLEKIKLSLRINNSAYDDEITDLINACKRQALPLLIFQKMMR